MPRHDGDTRRRPDLIELKLRQKLAATARVGLVSLRRCTAAPGLVIVRELMAQLLADEAA